MYIAAMRPSLATAIPEDHRRQAELQREQSTNGKVSDTSQSQLEVLNLGLYQFYFVLTAF